MDNSTPVNLSGVAYYPSAFQAITVLNNRLAGAFTLSGDILKPNSKDGSHRMAEFPKLNKNLNLFVPKKNRSSVPETGGQIVEGLSELGKRIKRRRGFVTL